MSCCNRLQFRISVPSIRSIRCHRQRLGIYISRTRMVENFFKPHEPAPQHCRPLVSGSSSSPPVHLHRWSPPPSTDFFTTVAAVANHHQVRVRIRSLCAYSSLRFLAQSKMQVCFTCMKSFYPAKKSFRIDLMQNHRVRFPPNPSRTDRFEDFGHTDSPWPLHSVQLGLTEVY
jgi:hypothetical protein